MKGTFLSFGSCLCFRYQDMRRQIGFEIRDMWYNLGNFDKLPVLLLFIFSCDRKQTFTSEWIHWSLTKALTPACWPLTRDTNFVFSIYNYLPTNYPLTHYKSTQQLNIKQWIVNKLYILWWERLSSQVSMAWDCK